MQVDIQTAAEVILKKKLHFDQKCDGSFVSFDSRTLESGNIFIVIDSDNPNVANHVEEAFAKGASFIIAKKNPLKNSDPNHDKFLVVDNPLEAFQQLARWWRSQFKQPILAVTGSAGKTTVKGMIASILSQQNKGYYSIKSYNNHIGVPFSICNMRKDDNWAVVEIGMNHLGEISLLTEIAKPDISIITNIEPAHIGLLGSLENIAKAKLEIVDGMKPGSSLIIPSNNQLLAKQIGVAGIDREFKMLTFGATPGSDCLISNYSQNDINNISFTLRVYSEEVSICMPILGQHNVFNAACSALACKTIFPHLPLASIKKGLEDFAPQEMRLNIIRLRNAGVIINDAYNANPSSVAAAFETLFTLRNNYPRIGVVIGDMLELGSYSEFYHEQISDKLVELNPNFVVAIGEFGELIKRKCENNSIHALSAKTSTANEITAFIIEKKFDLLLVKGSRGIQLEKLTTRLLEHFDVGLSPQ